MNRKLTLSSLFTIALLGASPLPAHAQAAAETPAAVHAADAAGMVWVTSPWGFTDLYCVHHGWNCLRCSGTGLRFRYYWTGC
jgi:hypothetical protein